MCVRILFLHCLLLIKIIKSLLGEKYFSFIIMSYVLEVYSSAALQENLHTIQLAFLEFNLPVMLHGHVDYRPHPKDDGR